MAEKISILIDLQGAQEVERQLADIGEAGQKAFADITEAAQEAGGFSQLKPEEVTKRLEDMGTLGANSIKKIQDAVGALSFREATQSIAALGKTSQEALAAAAAAAEKFGVPSGELRAVEGLIEAFAKRADLTGKSFTELASNYDKARTSATFLGQETKAATEDVAKVGVAADAAAVGLSATEVAVVAVVGVFAAFAAATAGATVELYNFAKAAADTVKVLGALPQAQKGFEDLSALGVVFAEGGTGVKNFAQEIGNLSDKIKAAGIEKAIRQSDDESVKWANDTQFLATQFDRLARGWDGTFSSLSRLDSKVKGLVESLTEVKGANEQLLKLADIFKSLPAEDRLQLGKALGLSPDFINTLALGSAAIRAMQQEVKDLKLSLDDADKFRLTLFTQSLARAGALFDALKEKLGALASPAFESFFRGIGDEIARLGPALRDLAAEFGALDLSELGRKLVDAGVAVITFINLIFQAVSGNKEAQERLKQGLTDLIEGAINAIIPNALAGGIKLGEAIVKGMLNSLKDGITNLFKDIHSFDDLFQAVIQDFAKFGEGIVRNFEILKTKIGQAWDAIKREFAGTAAAGDLPLGQSLLQGFDEALQQLRERAQQAGGEIKQVFVEALAGADFTGSFQPLIDAAQEVVSNISLLFTTFAESIAAGFQGVDFSGVFQPLIDAAQNAVNQISLLFTTMGQSLASAVDFSSLIAQIDNVTAAFNRMAASAASAAAAASGLGGGPQSVPGLEPLGLAGGGLLGGRGTGTSDSNLAWVSRGEHIMPARAVAQPGVLAFLEALRLTGGDLRRVLDQMGRFAVGGLIIPRMMPAFATGGLVGGGSMHPVTINFPGVGPISGLRASADTVAELQRAAAMAQVRSGGRKPSRYS